MREHEFTFLNITISVGWILLSVGIGCFISTIIESRNWSGFVSFIAKPLLYFSRLPSVCGTSFITAFLSNNAAGSMIAAAYAEKKITRREMFLSAIANSFPAKFGHMTRPSIIIIPLLGIPAILYLLLQFFLEISQVLLVISMGRAKDLSCNYSFEKLNKEILSWKETLKKSLKFAFRILVRVVLITVPIFILVAYLGDKGVFSKLEKKLPSELKTVLSPEIIAIMGSKLGGLVSSATVAAKMQHEGKVSALQILIAFMVANLITIPFNALRRNLPTALGIFPGRDGLWIVTITQSLRFAFNLAALAILIAIQLKL